MATSSFEAGDEVRVIRGKYKNEIAQICKVCPKQIWIRLHVPSTGRFEGVRTKLNPSQLLLISNDREAPEQSVTSRESRSLMQPTPVESSRVSRPVTSRTSRSLMPPTPVQPTRVSRRVTPPTPIESTSAPIVGSHVVETPQEEQQNPWAVQDAFDSNYHQELGLNVGLIILEAPGSKSSRKRTMAYNIFGDRLLHYEIPMGSAEANAEKFRDPHFPPKAHELENGRRYELLCSQVKQSKQKGAIPRMNIWIQYVLVSGPGISTIHLQDCLETVADFGIETPHKAAARIKLLNSPAVKSNRKNQDFFLIDLDTSDFEIIDEPTYHGYDKSMGSGYIPRSYIQRFLGNHAIGKRTSDIQVRVWCPALGVYKGMLTEKQGINKIQLTRSMQKLQPSRSMGNENYACLVISGVGLHPTKTNVALGNILSGEKDPPKSFNVKKLGFMLQTLWKQCGVSQETIETYVEASLQPRGLGLEHANVVGVPDPTDSIPAGYAFIPGFESVNVNHVLLNKYPSCGAQDAKLIPILKSKPDNMSSSDWSFLCGQHFGKIVFGNPADTNTPPIPAELGVDMDGDLYFICWNANVLAECEPRARDSCPRGDDDVTLTPRQYNPTWFTDARALFFDLRTMVRFSLLIKALHKAWKKEHEDGDRQDMEKADAYGRAFKQSLDLEKQGKKVFLPRPLWSAVSPTLHGLLCDTEELESLHLVTTPSGVRVEEESSAVSSRSPPMRPVMQAVQQPSTSNPRATIVPSRISIEQPTRNPQATRVPSHISIEQPTSNPTAVIVPSIRISTSSYATSDTDTFVSLPVVSDEESLYNQSDGEESDDGSLMSFQTASSHDEEESLLTFYQDCNE